MALCHMEPGLLIFLSTLSLRRATCTAFNGSAFFIHFYPRSPCGERLFNSPISPISHNISIHALLAESDPFLLTARFLNSISIHALLAESDHKMAGAGHSAQSYFYPRSPCGERLKPGSIWHKAKYFYPRSPCGERHTGKHLKIIQIDISIHALLAESDTWARGSRITYVEFLSTLSLRRATQQPAGTTRTT